MFKTRFGPLDKTICIYSADALFGNAKVVTNGKEIAN